MGTAAPTAACPSGFCCTISNWADCRPIRCIRGYTLLTIHYFVIALPPSALFAPAGMCWVVALVVLLALGAGGGSKTQARSMRARLVLRVVTGRDCFGYDSQPESQMMSCSTNGTQLFHQVGSDTTLYANSGIVKEFLME
jgi:hypothetical protein